MRALLFALLSLSAPALACGPYMAMPTQEAGPVLSITLADGRSVSTTEVPGQLQLTMRDGSHQVFETWLWDVASLEEVEGELRVTGTQFGMEMALARSVAGLASDDETFRIADSAPSPTTTAPPNPITAPPPSPAPRKT